MSRWIDADALPRHGQRGGIVHWKDIEDAPSIEIIRCGECKWFDSKGHCMRLTAEYGTYEDVRTDDFCSYGERSSE